ncbi:hypothetical protein NEUTE1DRAFT_34759, partial [Neurospora tetrasperma FGSC 2508]
IIIDRFIKIQYYIPIITLEAEELVNYFINRIYYIYSLLDSILSNRGTQFILHF